MKKKTKKVLAGIGLGVMGAMSLTGCKSNITFNQSDLDNVINGVNKYLETQNNYSSEFARNTLMGYIMDAMSTVNNVKSYAVEVNSWIYDAYGNKKEDTDMMDQYIYKVYNNTQTSKTKIYSKSEDVERYSELTFNPNNPSYYGFTDYVKNEEVANYSADDYEDFKESAIDGGRYCPTVILSNALFFINQEGLACEDFIMNQISINEIEFKCIAYDVEHSMIGSYTIKFKDGNLTELKMKNIGSLTSSSQETIMTCQYNIDDFTFDTNGYTAISSAPQV